MTTGFSARIKTSPNTVAEHSRIASANEKEGSEVVASRLQRYPRLMFVNDVGDLELRETFGPNALIEEGRAEIFSEEVNFEDDDDVVTWDSKRKLSDT
jgi:hypothetical protein